MFFRTKTSGPRTYLQIVENRWEDGRTRQRVVATLGRLDQLQQTGQLDALLVSGARLAQSVLLLSAHAQGQLPTITTRRIGPALVSQRLWQQTGCQRVIEQLLDGRRFECKASGIWKPTQAQSYASLPNGEGRFEALQLCARRSINMEGTTDQVDALLRSGARRLTGYQRRLY